MLGCSWCSKQAIMGFGAERGFNVSCSRTLYRFEAGVAVWTWKDSPEATRVDAPAEGADRVQGLRAPPSARTHRAPTFLSRLCQVLKPQVSLWASQPSGPFPSISASLSPFGCRLPGSLPQSRAPGRLAGGGRRRRPSSVIGRPLSLRARLAPFAQAASASLHGCPFWSDSHLLPLPRVPSKRGAVEARWRDLTAAKAGTGAAGVGRPNSAWNRLRQVTRSSSL